MSYIKKYFINVEMYIWINIAEKLSFHSGLISFFAYKESGPFFSL